MTGKCKHRPRCISDFWHSVRVLAAMRRFIPKERRRMSGVLEAMRSDRLTRTEGK